MATYRANCHCGKFVYEVTFPAPIAKAAVCNCSICHKKGYVHVFLPEGQDISIAKGSLDELSSYKFGTHYDHKFCGTCGSAVLIVPTDSTKPKIVNLRCFQGPLDLWALDKDVFDGASLPPPYKEPQFTGVEPTGSPRDGGPSTLYHGSCHCGAVRIALRSQPLDPATLSADKDADKLIECNCSICQRVGNPRWFYPMIDQVSVEDPDNNIMHYSYGRFGNRKIICRKCGVCVANEGVGLSPEEIAALPAAAHTADAVAWRARFDSVMPVNTRVLHGLDFDKLPYIKFDGYKEFEPPYQNP